MTMTIYLSYLALIVSIFLSLTSQRVIVHLIMHAHTDAGWVRTFENIYKNTGSKILTTVTEELFKNEDFRFNWADHIFLERWW